MIATGGRSLVLGSVLAVAFACAASDPDDHLPNREVAFRCPGDQQFVAVFEPDLDSVVINLRGERTRLPHVPAASGAKYSDGSTTFWSKDDEALLELPGESYRDCIGTTIWPPDDAT
jgi:membrane-bound inhibitor of C-type lysozyme